MQEFHTKVNKMTRIIKNISSTQRHVNPKIIAKALGVDEVGVKIDTRNGMGLFVDFLNVRDDLEFEKK